MQNKKMLWYKKDLWQKSVRVLLNHKHSYYMEDAGDAPDNNIDERTKQHDQPTP